MSKIAVVVCNRCEELGKPTRPYLIRQGRRKAEIDLCVDDGEYLESFLNGRPSEPRVESKPPEEVGRAIQVPAKRSAAAKKAPAKKAARGGRKPGVVTMEEIEGLKTSGKKG